MSKKRLRWVAKGIIGVIGLLVAGLVIGMLTNCEEEKANQSRECRQASERSAGTVSDQQQKSCSCSTIHCLGT